MARSRGTRSAREQRQILIVDDEESLAFFLRQGLLEVDSDWLIDTAATGEEAVIKINRSAYQLIISDLRMPGLNGLELIQMIRALEPGTRVVLMTAYGSAKVEEEAHRLGVFRYLAKPFAIDEVKALAVEALGAGTGVGAKPDHQANKEMAPAEQKPRERSQASQPSTLPRTEPSQEPSPLEPAGPPLINQPTSRDIAEEWRDRVRAQLAQLRFKMGAELTLVAGFDHSVLATAGDVQTLNVDDLVALCARSLQTALEGRKLVGQGEAPAALLIQQGQRQGICSAVIDSNWMLVVVHGPGRRSWRLDSIAAAVRQAASALRPALEAASDRGADGAESPQAKRQEETSLPGPARSDGPKRAEHSGDMTTAHTDTSPDALMSDMMDDASDKSDDQVFSLDQAQALGLIDKDLLSRILEE